MGGVHGVTKDPGNASKVVQGTGSSPDSRTRSAKAPPGEATASPTEAVESAEKWAVK